MSNETKSKIWFNIAITVIYLYGVYWYIEGIVK